MTSKKKLTVYVEEDLIKEAKKAVIDNNTSLSSIISQFLAEYVEKEKEGLK